MRLFAVKDRSTGKLALSGEFFSNKKEAKDARTELNPPRSEDFVQGTLERYFVVKGPDHRLYKK